MSAGRGPEIVAHYGTERLWERVRTALGRAGLDGATVTWSELAPLDQFHVGGLAATRELAAALHPAAGDAVLDVGSGLGGPARLLAAERGCQVTGIDLSPEFVDVATRLTERAGLSTQVRFHQGDATRLPFGPAAFDHAWTQHVAMNVADRAALYAEVRRVLAPGGRFAIHDVVAADGRPLAFPVPWARSADTSFLLTAAQTRAALTAAGWRELSFADRTEEAIAWFRRRAARAGPAGQSGGPGAPALGLPVVMGPGFAEMTANLAENLRTGRAGVITLVVRAADQPAT